MNYPPTPPQPLVPPQLAHLFTKETPREVYDAIFRANGYTGPISYCFKLCEHIDKPPERDPFSWVDNDLRETIYRCMYHNPTHRPDLEELLNQAKAKMGSDNRPDEDDASVRDWVKRWFYDAHPAEAPPSDPPSDDDEDTEMLDVSNGSGGGGGGGGGFGAAGGLVGRDGTFVVGGPGALGYFLPGVSGLPPLDANHQAALNRYILDYPHGTTRVFNAAGDLQCGREYSLSPMAEPTKLTETPVQAIADSIIRQVPPAILPVNTTNPTLGELQGILRNLINTGYFPHGVIPELRFYSADVLAAVLQTWGSDRGVQLRLVVMLSNGSPYLIPSPDPTARPIYIYSNWLGSGMPMTNCHYEGLDPVAAPAALGPGEV